MCFIIDVYWLYSILALFIAMFSPPLKMYRIEKVCIFYSGSFRTIKRFERGLKVKDSLQVIREVMS